MREEQSDADEEQSTNLTEAIELVKSPVDRFEETPSNLGDNTSLRALEDLRSA